MALIAIFRRYLTPQFDARRFEWLYCRGAYGEAAAWVACDLASDEIVGAAAAFPRRLYLDGIEKVGFVFGDFCMDERYRSLGPSLQLQRACLGIVEENPFEFFYDFPSVSMMAVYKRLGIGQTGTLVRWAKPLRVEAKVQNMVGSKGLAKGVGLVANAILALRGWKCEKSACEMELHEGLCDDEFTVLDKQLQPRAGVQTARPAQYLNWRYLEHPNSTYEILKARRAGALIGYVVYSRDPIDASIVDLNSIEEPAVVARLLAGAVERLRTMGTATVSLNASDAHPWSELFKRAGFCRRETSPAVVYSRMNASVSSHDFQRNWYAMRGERDS